MKKNALVSNLCLLVHILLITKESSKVTFCASFLFSHSELKFQGDILSSKGLFTNYVCKFLAFLTTYTLVNVVCERPPNCESKTKYGAMNKIVEDFLDIQIVTRFNWDPHFLCWISGVVPFNTWPNYLKLRRKYMLLRAKWASHKMTPISL